MKKAIGFILTMLFAISLCGVSYAADTKSFSELTGVNNVQDIRWIEFFNEETGEKFNPVVTDTRNALLPVLSMGAYSDMGADYGKDAKRYGIRIHTFTNSQDHVYEYVISRGLEVDGKIYLPGNDTEIAQTIETLWKRWKAKDEKPLSYTESGVKYDYHDLGDHIEICGVNAGDETSVTFPAEIDSKPVKSLDFMAYDEDFAKVKELKISDGIEEMADSIFHDCAALKSVELPDSIKKIPSSAFADCIALEKVTLPKQLLIIGDMAFKGCKSLNNIDLPDTLATIKSKAFSYSGLTSVTIPQSVERIEKGAFGSSQLTKAALHNDIISIGEKAFLCDTLNEITGLSDEKLMEFYPSFKDTPFGIAFGGDRAFQGSEPLTADNILIPAENVTLTENAFKGIDSAANKLSETPEPALDDIADTIYKNEINDLNTFAADTYRVGGLDIPYDFGNAERLAALGLLYGTDHGFALDEKVTRAQAAVMVLRMIGEEENGADGAASPFADMRGHWAEAAVARAYNLKIVSGTSTDTFEPEREVTGREFVRMLLGAMGYDNITIENSYDKGVETQVLLNNFTKTAVRTEGYTLCRNDMAGICHSALTAKTADGDWLKDKLIENGIFSEPLFESIMTCSIPLAPIK